MSTTYAYPDRELEALLAGAGFRRVDWHPSLAGAAAEPDRDFAVLVCRSQERA